MKIKKPTGTLPFFEKGERLSAAKLNLLSAAILARTPNTGVGTSLVKSANGFSYSSSGGKVTELEKGFEVYTVKGSEQNNYAEQVTVYPSVIVGLDGLTHEIPTIGIRNLLYSPAPKLDVQPDDYIFIKIEIEPVAEGNAQDGYTMSDSEIVIESVEVVALGNDSDAQKAEINEATGAVTANMIAFVPLAANTENGIIQLMYGPLAVAWCVGSIDIKPSVYVTG